MDRNTYLHFGIAFIGALVITLISNESYASWMMGSAILTWELCQAMVLLKRNIKLRWQSIFFDVLTGVIGVFVGAIIAVWIK